MRIGSGILAAGRSCKYRQFIALISLLFILSYYYLNSYFFLLTVLKKIDNIILFIKVLIV